MAIPTRRQNGPVEGRTTSRALLGGSRDGVAAGNQRPDAGKQFTPILDRIDQRIEAADQERGYPKVVIVQHRLRHLVRRSH